MTTTKTAQRRTKAAPEAAPPRAKRASRRAPTKGPLVLMPPAEDMPPATRKPPAGKLGIVVGLLRRPEGATVAQMSEATDWLPHSVRGAVAGSLKKKHGLAIVSEPAEGGRIYRLAEAAA